MEVTGTVERASCLQTASFYWKIKDFSQILGRGYSWVSPKFHVCGHAWYLELNKNAFYDNIELILWSKAPYPASDTPYSLGIRSASGKTEMEAAGTRSFFLEEYSKVFVKSICIKRPELFSRREELFPFDVLTVTATLKVKSAANCATYLHVHKVFQGIPPEDEEDEQGEKTVPSTRDVSVQTRVEDRASESEEDEQGEKTGTERVLQDIGKMWPSDEQSDVVFKVGDVEFKAHRAILSARTPALGAMFRHDTAEKASGVVTIDDCEPAVFEQLLHYVYRGAPRELTAENAFPLYTVADKYLVNEVKTLCVRYMRDTLCVDTFCNTVTLSLVHREDELLETAIDFFSRNMLDILQTVQWQTFLWRHSTWANEIMIGAEKVRQERKT